VVVTTTQEVVSPSTKELVGAVSATYTYGELVEGELEVIVAQDLPSWARSDQPQTGSGHTIVAVYSQPHIEGTADFRVSLENVQFSYGYALEVTAVVKEAATGETQNGTGSVRVASQDHTVETSADAFFTPGSTYPITFEVKAADGSAVNDVLKVTVAVNTMSYSPRDDLVFSVDIVDSHGYLEVDLPADDSSCCEEEDIVNNNWRSCCYNWLSVSPTSLEATDSEAYGGYLGGYHSASRATDSTVPSAALEVKETGEGGTQRTFTVSTASEGASVDYAVIGRLGVVAVGKLAIAGTSAELQLEVTGDMAPSATLLTWMLVDGTMVADSLVIDAAAQLAHDVSVAFSATEAQPGDVLQVTASGAPGGRAFVLAVDRSVALQAGGSSELTSDEVVASAQAFNPSGSSECGSYSEPTAETHMVNAGMIALTSATIPACEGDLVWLEEAMMVDAADGAVAEADEAMFRRDATPPSSGESEVTTTTTKTRSYFPEAWLWRHVDLDLETGLGSFNTTAPDTITTWDLSAFGVAASEGLGIAASSELRVFKPFFVRPNVPYSLTRHEGAQLAVAVYSYLEEDMEVTVDLTTEGDALEVTSAMSVTVQVAAGGYATAMFEVVGTRAGTTALVVTGTASTGGRSDAVQKAVLVEAEGIKQVATQNVVARLEGDTAEAVYYLNSTVPADTVEGSAWAQVSVIGDMMGQTVAGLERLLRIPYGCGEQNMITTAPNVFVMQYLTGVGKLDAELTARANRNMLLGYQRELTYRHTDASFSAFGTSDASGSTWLTAFVVKTFAQAAQFVYVDPEMLRASATWLQDLQQRDGSFEARGSVIHTEMQGGAGSGVSLTAYVLIALLEAGTGVVEESTVTAAVGYLEAADTHLDTYSAVISAYAMALACAKRGLGCGESASSLSYIESIAITSDGLTHWQKLASTPPPSKDGQEEISPWYQRRATSSEIELTAYGLLAYVSAGRVADSFPVARWVMEQRNDLGGFSSTQDTVVALQALAEYSSAVYSDDVLITVDVTGPEGFAWSAEVTKDNLDLLQVRDAPVGGVLEARVSGSGFALVQLAVHFNLPEEQEPPAYDLQVTWSNVTGTNGGSMIADVCMQMFTADEQEGTTAEVGMVLAEVGLYSGYSATTASMERLVAAQSLVKRAEASADARAVQVYLEEVTTAQRVCFTLEAQRSSVVTSLQPTECMVYPYYEPTRRTVLTTSMEGETCSIDHFNG
ncbi:hypothetical protein CYMTET_51942, partial [Cymbomonas tetramitiformis]